MVEQLLADCRVLIVEDEYALADELRYELSRVGAFVIGPVGNLQGAIDLVCAEGEIDLAVLDLNLIGEAVFPVADRLAERGVPMVFATGYDTPSVPPRFSQIATFVKPVAIITLIETIRSKIQT